MLHKYLCDQGKTFAGMVPKLWAAVYILAFSFNNYFIFVFFTAAYFNVFSPEHIHIYRCSGRVVDDKSPDDGPYTLLQDILARLSHRLYGIMFTAGESAKKISQTKSRM